MYKRQLKQRLRQFRDDIIKEFGLESIDEDEWEEKRDDFLDKIKIIAQQKNVKTTPSNPCLLYTSITHLIIRECIHKIVGERLVFTSVAFTFLPFCR